MSPILLLTEERPEWSITFESRVAAGPTRSQGGALAHHLGREGWAGGLEGPEKQIGPKGLQGTRGMGGPTWARENGMGALEGPIAFESSLGPRVRKGPGCVGGPTWARGVGWRP